MRGDAVSKLQSCGTCYVILLPGLMDRFQARASETGHDKLQVVNGITSLSSRCGHSFSVQMLGYAGKPLCNHKPFGPGASGIVAVCVCVLLELVCARGSSEDSVQVRSQCCLSRRLLPACSGSAVW